jgi:hypothetical protein
MWDEELVRQTLHFDDVQIILAILVNEDMDDLVGVILIQRANLV